MSDDTATAADRRLEAVLAERGARDPREFYRERLRELKRHDAAAYERAVDYYRNTLLPTVASGEVDPLVAWTEYGRRLAVSLESGRTVAIDRSGRARAYEEGIDAALVLHLPEKKGVRALLVGLPEELSDAQRATYDVLVAGKHRR